MSNYNLKPEIVLHNEKRKVLINSEIISAIKSEIAKGKKTIVFETYPGVRLDVLKKEIINKLKPKKLIWSEEYALQGNEFRKAILPEMTEDRVFGRFTSHEFKDYFKSIKLSINKNELTVIFGTGASYLAKADLLIYVDVTRWELQLRYRKKEKVFFGGTLEDETIKNFKRGYFIEWRMADKLKKQLINKIDYFIDSTTDELKMINSKMFFDALSNGSNRPFRLVPYFDAGVWGGKWMQDKFNLGSNEQSKWAWGFDGVPEENSIRFRYPNTYFEMPAINMVFFKSKELLGEIVWNRFGEEFPIRFDFLDTIKGQNLSLQVHPTTEYIYEQFGAKYTQEESYYILDVDTKAKPTCFLGIKSGVKEKDFIDALNNAQKTNKFDENKFTNRFPAKKHDHFIHPAGVIHSSASGCMVLEISATPYIFTFKLWDWGRVDFNGKPRPINIEHGKHVIDYSFDTKRCAKELVSPFVTLVNTKEYKEEKTGLHPRQFIETRRFTIKTNKGVVIENKDSVNMLNLVDGQEAIVESIDKSFEPLIVTYAETFIVPEKCKKYRIKPYGLSLNKEVMVIQAYVRTK